MLVKCEPTKPTNGYAVIELTKGRVCIVDAEDYDHLNSYLWLAFKWSYRYYAVRKVTHNGKSFWLPMHRQITHCPRHLIVHHDNYNTLDNRKKNLVVMTKVQHNELHGYRKNRGKADYQRAQKDHK